MSTLTKDQVLTFKSLWAKHASHNLASSGDHILYNIVMNRPIHTGFTPTTNKSKLMNGHAVNYCLFHSIWLLKKLTKPEQHPIMSAMPEVDWRSMLLNVSIPPVINCWSSTGAMLISAILSSEISTFDQIEKYNV